MRPFLAACLSLFVLSAAACGGGAPPPESPAAEAPSTPTADEAAPSPTKGEPSSEDTVNAAPASDDDIKAVLQLVIDDPELDRHLHLGEPGRFPLKIAGEKVPPGVQLIKGAEAVKVTEPPQSKKDAVLVFTEIDLRGDTATVRYRYDVEGVRATVTLARSSHGWELKNSRLVEH